MSFKYVISNLLLTFVILMVVVENYETWTQPIELPEHQETVKKLDPKAENLPAVGTNKEATSLRSFIVISEKNIFSPVRKDFPIVGVEKSSPTTRPQVVLYGVTIAGDYQVASITSSGRPLRKGDRETVTLKLGEQIGGYKVAKIHPDRITMESNGDSFEVLLYDSRNPKKRAEAKIEVKPLTVASTQPAPAGPPVAAPASASPSASASVEKVPPAAAAEKPKEQQQQVVPSTPTPTLRPIPPLGQLSRQRRGVMPVYPPTSPPTGAPEEAQ